jgi:hypothetical protein
MSVRRGSQTISSPPRPRNSLRYAFWFPSGSPWKLTSGFEPMRISTSMSANFCGGASQAPWKPTASVLPGWSMVLVLKRIGDPMASMNAPMKGLFAGGDRGGR